MLQTGDRPIWDLRFTDLARFTLRAAKAGFSQRRAMGMNKDKPAPLASLRAILLQMDARNALITRVDELP
jgi:hypothetical protein